MPLFYISTASVFTPNKCLSILLVLLVSPLSHLFGGSWFSMPGPRQCLIMFDRMNTREIPKRETYLSSSSKAACKMQPTWSTLEGVWSSEGRNVSGEQKGHFQAHRSGKKKEQLLIIVTGKVHTLSCGLTLQQRSLDRFQEENNKLFDLSLLLARIFLSPLHGQGFNRGSFCPSHSRAN